MSVAGGSLKRSTGGAAGEQESSTKRKRTAASGTGPNNSRVVNIDLPGNVDGKPLGYTDIRVLVHTYSYTSKLIKSSDSYILIL